jgi:hypothetical protein
MNDLVGIHYILAALPIWATAMLLYIITMGVLFVLRDRSEGFFYNTSYSAMLGDAGLLAVVLMAAGVLQRGGQPPSWLQDGGYQAFAGLAGLVFGVVWLVLDFPRQWGDRYHHMVIAPLLCYLGITLLPVIFKNGTKTEIASTISMIALFAGLVVYDARTKRLDQRRYIAKRIHVK